MNWRIHPVVISLIVGTFLARLGTYMTMPFLAIYLHQSRGMDAGTIGAIIGVSFLVGTFSSFFGGVWSDRFGRYPVMLLAILGWSLSFVGFAYAASPLAFLLLSSLYGFSRNVFEPTSKALLSDITPADQQQAVFNARYFAINLGASIGPLVGVYLGSSRTASPFFLTTAIFLLYGLLLAIMMIRFPKQSRSVQHNETITIRSAFTVVISDKVFRYFLIGNMFVVAAYSHMESTLAQFMGNAPDFENGVTYFSYLILANTISVVVLQYPVLRLVKRMAPITAMLFGSMFFGLGLLGFGIFHSLLPLILSMVVFTLGEILCFIQAELVINEIAPEHLRGTYFGASGLQFIGQSVGPWIGGALLHSFGFTQGPLVFGLLMVITLLAIPFFAASKKQVDTKNVPIHI